jgi:hypothetical protein
MRALIICFVRSKLSLLFNGAFPMRPPLSKAAAAEMREFFGRYGSFIQLWQTYELMIEIAIMRQLGISVEENSIVCGGLNYSAKMSITLGLLIERRHESKCSLRTANGTADGRAE